MDKDGGESALLKISHEAPDKPYILEVCVLTIYMCANQHIYISPLLIGQG